jgi:hypothetical protein
MVKHQRSRYASSTTRVRTSEPICATLRILQPNRLLKYWLRPRGSQVQVVYLCIAVSYFEISAIF